MAIVTSKEVNAELTKLAKGAGLSDVWLGGTDEKKEGEWVWADGTKFEYTNWEKTQPNNKAGLEHYLLLKAGTGKWADQPVKALTGHSPGYVCEWPPVLKENPPVNDK